MSKITPIENKTKFWVVCCEDTEVTQKIANAVSDWNLPGVRSLITNQLTAENIAEAEYAIFITTDAQPCAQIKISPLSLAHAPGSGAADAADAVSQTPAAQLLVMHERHGSSPQSWWFKLPTSEVRAQKVQPVATDKSVAQALAQIEVFVRNYTRALSSGSSTSGSSTVVATAAVNHDRNAVSVQPAKAQSGKRKVVLTHYRRL